jgi:ACS family tartrate transporter-like MFS transporter
MSGPADLSESAREIAIGRKILRRLVFPSALFILMGAIDRTNVGFASLQMNSALGFSGTQYGFGAGVLFVGYIAAKYPSVLLYERIGMHRWLALISLCWGCAATAMSLIQNELHFFTLRLIIGFAEGGLSSGLMLYLSHWATERYRASVLAIPIAAISITQVIGGPVSGWLLQASNPAGLEGWRWMFLVEGIPPLLLAIFAWFYFPDRPSDARWLSPADASWLESHARGATKPKQGEPGRWSALSNKVTWLSAAIWFCLLAGNYGILFWLPQMVRGLSGLPPFEVGLVVALPWLGSAIALFINARHSDRTQERFLHIAVPSIVAAVAFTSAYLLGSGIPGLLALVVGGACLGCTVAPFWAIPTRLIPPVGLAMGIVTINIVGSFAGVTIPTAMGILRDRTGSFLPPTLLLSAVLIIGACLCLYAKRIERRQADQRGH